MSPLAASLLQLAIGLVGVTVAFGMGVAWANARSTDWRRRALRLQAERDTFRAALVARTHDGAVRPFRPARADDLPRQGVRGA